jgi:hypothetical protein
MGHAVWSTAVCFRKLGKPSRRETCSSTHYPCECATRLFGIGYPNRKVERVRSSETAVATGRFVGDSGVWGIGSKFDVTPETASEGALCQVARVETSLVCRQAHAGADNVTVCRMSVVCKGGYSRPR